MAELPWGHNSVLLKKLTEPEHRRWYAQRAVERGWSRLPSKPRRKGKNPVKAEYALRGLNRPIGVADWETRLVESLPENLAGALPSVEELDRNCRSPENERRNLL